MNSDLEKKSTFVYLWGMESKNNTIKPGELLKLRSGREAIIYRVLSMEITSVRVAETCRIGRGKMLLIYSNQVESHIYHSDVGTAYKKVTGNEKKRILSILENYMGEIGV